MKAQHTPGPWTANFGSREQGTSGALIRDRVGIVAEAYPRNPSGTEQTENARLIAAAPDLLAALQAVDRADAYTHERGEALAKARAAIAKAIGGA